MCMRPNLCLCKGNKSLGIPTKLAPSCDISQLNPQSNREAEQTDNEDTDRDSQLSQPQSNILG